MMGKQHAIFGLATGAATTLTLTELGIMDSFTSNNSMIFIGITLLGALLPDIDKTNSTLGKILLPISFILSKIMKHRTLTHDVLLMMLFMIGSLFFFGFDCLYVYALWLGVFGHLLLDASTYMGVPFGYLFNKERRIHILPYKLRLISDSTGAKVFTMMLSIFVLGGTYYLLTNLTGFTFH